MKFNFPPVAAQLPRMRINLIHSELHDPDQTPVEPCRPLNSPVRLLRRSTFGAWYLSYFYVRPRIWFGYKFLKHLIFRVISLRNVLQGQFLARHLGFSLTLPVNP